MLEHKLPEDVVHEMIRGAVEVCIGAFKRYMFFWGLWVYEALPLEQCMYLSLKQQTCTTIS